MTIELFVNLSTRKVCNLKSHNYILQYFSFGYLIGMKTNKLKRTSSIMTCSFWAYFNLTINDPPSWPENGPLNMICICIDGDMVDIDTIAVPPESSVWPVSSELKASVSNALNLH